MERTVPFTMFEITIIERGAIASVVVRPIEVTHIGSGFPTDIGFIDADGFACRGKLTDYYASQHEAIADLEAAA